MSNFRLTKVKIILLEKFIIPLLKIKQYDTHK
jgi:hypothetical protein